MLRFAACIVLVLSAFISRAATLLVEAEAFDNHGGWVVDQQFMDQMGSPYLMAHGLGKPVADATTSLTIKEPGTYRVLVRTRNWAAPWSDKEAPGRFQVLVKGVGLGKEQPPQKYNLGGTLMGVKRE